MAARKVEHQILFDVRRWAVTPDRRVVEVTDASRGMSEHDHAALQAAVQAGTVTEADLAAPRGSWPASRAGGREREPQPPATSCLA